MLLYEVVIMLGVAAAGLLLGRLARLPSVVAYLLAGVVAGHGVLGVVGHSAAIEQLADFGVALLLFGVGIEFSLDRIRRVLWLMLGGGTAQVVGVMVLTAGTFRFLGQGWPASLALGFLVALSSTALVFKLFEERGQLDAPYGQATAGILLFQDLALVPMMLLLPVLGSTAGEALPAAGEALARAAIAIVVLLLAARAVLPALLTLVAKARIPEVFPIVALFIALGTALVATAFGLSIPIGAFLAGVALSGTAYGHQVFAELLPLRDAFVALFFTSVGALLDPFVLFASPALLGALVGTVVLKGLLIALIVGIAWRSVRLGLLVGCALAQIGEFSFVLAREAEAVGLLDKDLVQVFLAAAVLTMAATPYVIAGGRRLAFTDVGSDGSKQHTKADVVIVGYDGTGQAVGRVLGSTSIPFVVLDTDPARVKEGQHDGVPVRFGDGTRRATLEAAGVGTCRAVVVAVNDLESARRVVSVARQMNPRATILVRAQTVSQVRELERLGANEVVPAEFEASIELFGRLLTRLGVPRHVARVQEGIIRLDNYSALRGAGGSTEMMEDLQRLIRAGTLEQAEVMEGSEAVGKTLGELSFREATGAAPLVILRGEEPIANPREDDHFEAGDLVVIYGPHAGIAAALVLFEPKIKSKA